MNQSFLGLFKIKSKTRNEGAFLLIAQVTVIVLCLFSSPVFAGTHTESGAILHGLNMDRKNLNSVETKEQTKSLIAPSCEVKDKKIEDEREFKLETIHFSGQSIYSDQSILDMMGEKHPKRGTKGYLDELAKRTTNLFQQEGYLMAEAITLPKNNDGAAEIQVDIGRFGKIEVKNNVADLWTGKLRGAVASVKSGDPIERSKIERILRVLSSIERVNTRVALSKSSAAGCFDLTIEAENGNGRVWYEDDRGRRFDGVTFSPGVSSEERTKFKVDKFIFSGELPQNLNADQLESVTKPYRGYYLDFNQLEKIADRVSSFLKSDGYVTSLAFIPPQKIEHNTVEIGIKIGKVGEVHIENNSRIQSDKLLAFTSGLADDTYISNARIEDVLHRMNQMYGAYSYAKLKQGTTAGKVDIDIVTESTNPVSGYLYTDNHGGEYSGQYRYGVNFDFLNVSGIGDRARIGGIISNKDLRNYYFIYEMIAGHSGDKIGISYSAMDYTLSDFFRLLGAEGNARVFSVYGNYPISKDSGGELSLNYGYDQKKIVDRLDAFNISTEKSSDVLHIGVIKRNTTERSIGEYALTYYYGNLSPDSESAQNANKYSNVEGVFHKGDLEVTHIEKLDKNMNLHLKLHGQMASRNLDSSEQMYLGGPNGVRAYTQGEGSGDLGYQATAELKWKMKKPFYSMSLFADTGEIRVRKDGEQLNNHRRLSGWGIGLQYEKPKDYIMRLDYAWKINAAKELETDSDNGRLWFQMVKMF